MRRLYLSKHKDKIILAAKPFASGGEGKLFKIRSPKNYQNRVAKIYHPHKLTEEKVAKLQILLKDPLARYQLGEQPSFVWPEDLLENERGGVVGFIMPLVSGQKLELFCFSSHVFDLDQFFFCELVRELGEGLCSFFDFFISCCLGNYFFIYRIFFWWILSSSKITGSYT